MFSNSHNIVREKKFIFPRKNVEKSGTHHFDSDTITDNHTLFLAQRERVRAATHQPTSWISRLFRWR